MDPPLRTGDLFGLLIANLSEEGPLVGSARSRSGRLPRDARQWTINHSGSYGDILSGMILLAQVERGSNESEEMRVCPRHLNHLKVDILRALAPGHLDDGVGLQASNCR